MKVVILLMIVSFCCCAKLTSAGETEDEIEHLVNYIRNSGCTFIRNDKEHGSHEAVDHILRKYEYFKEDIQTTEDFIELCATKSTVSKKDYYIKCGSREPEKTKDWLTDELMRFRSK